MTTYTQTDASNVADTTTGLQTAEERRSVLSVQKDTNQGKAHNPRKTLNV